MMLSGALAGVGGLNYVLGYKHYYEEGFGTGSGFLGIAVALVGRNHPVGIVIAALLFATLSQGGLAVNALVPKQMVDVLTAVVIISVATAVPEVRRALAASRRRIAGRGNQGLGSELLDPEETVNPGPSSQFPVAGPRS
jgi:simple sugar transport system permease protein